MKLKHFGTLLFVLGFAIALPAAANYGLVGFLSKLTSPLCLLFLIVGLVLNQIGKRKEQKT